ncbi:MAG: hypothetical protein J6S58_05230 [Lentisphaeria bacterium]|nr:hypothetical protein [Lentisphaeria bacterium]
MENQKKIRCCIPATKIENDGYDWWKRHEDKCALVKEKKFEVIFLGDSITHFWSAENNVNYGQGHWDEVFAGKNVLNLGYGFDRIQNVLWRIENGELENQDPGMFILNIGTNQFSVTKNYDGDTPEETVQGICFLADKLRKDFPQSKIVVMALFPRNNHMQEVMDANKLLHEAISRRSDLILLDIFEELCIREEGCVKSAPNCFQPDGTHPNRNGYEVWFKALQKYL